MDHKTHSTNGNREMNAALRRKRRNECKKGKRKTRPNPQRNANVKGADKKNGDYKDGSTHDKKR